MIRIAAALAVLALATGCGSSAPVTPSAPGTASAERGSRTAPASAPTTAPPSSGGSFTPNAFCAGMRKLFADLAYGGKDEFGFVIDADPGEQFISYEGGTEPDTTSPGWHCEFDHKAGGEYVEARLINIPPAEAGWPQTLEELKLGLPGKTCVAFTVPGYHFGFQCVADDGADTIIDMYATAGRWTLWCGAKLYPATAESQARDRELATKACPAVLAAARE